MTNMGSIYRTQTRRGNDSPFWDGFTDRFQNLWHTTKDHYILMPALTAGIITAAIISNPFGWALTGVAAAMITYQTYQASSDYFLNGNQEKGLTEFGETTADIALLGGGFALGGAGQAITKARIGTNAGVAIHLVDEVAAGILAVQKFLQH